MGDFAGTRDEVAEMFDTQIKRLFAVIDEQLTRPEQVVSEPKFHLVLALTDIENHSHILFFLAA